MFEILRYAAYIFNLHCVKTTNNPRKSVRLFKEQINKTKNRLQIFDDGNKIESDGKNMRIMRRIIVRIFTIIPLLWLR